MTGPGFCNDKVRLAGYLYDECGEDERWAIEAHLATCAACTVEIEQLRSVRASLARWAAPEPASGLGTPASGFTDLGALPPAASVAGRRRTPPRWLMAAAAVLVGAAAAGLAQLEVEYGFGGFVVRTGWARATPVRTAPPPAPASFPPEWRQELAAFERDLRARLLPATDARAASGGRARAADQAGPADDDALLRRVQALIDRSEQRQQRELAQQITGVLREVEMQRRADLRGVQQTVGELEGQTGIAVRQNQELANYLYQMQRVSQPR